MQKFLKDFTPETVYSDIVNSEKKNVKDLREMILDVMKLRSNNYLSFRLSEQSAQFSLDIAQFDQVDVNIVKLELLQLGFGCLVTYINGANGKPIVAQMNVSAPKKPKSK